MDNEVCFHHVHCWMASEPSFRSPISSYRGSYESWRFLHPWCFWWAIWSTTFWLWHPPSSWPPLDGVGWVGCQRLIGVLLDLCFWRFQSVAELAPNVFVTGLKLLVLGLTNVLFVIITIWLQLIVLKSDQDASCHGGQKLWINKLDLG